MGRYKLKEIRRHGEAASVDLKAVKAERERVKRINALYPPEDTLNLDETLFFPKAPPDRGLATKHMSGQKKDKFRIPFTVACNATGTEKLPLLFIGKSNALGALGKSQVNSTGCIIAITKRHG